jgi:hypothetical protein
VEGYLRVAEQAAQMPATRLVYIADREGDFIDLMAQAHAIGTPVDWLIRSAHNRKLVGEQDKLWEGFGEQHVLGEISFTLPARSARQVGLIFQLASRTLGLIDTRLQSSGNRGHQNIALKRTLHSDG